MNRVNPIETATKPKDVIDGHSVDIDLLYRSHWAELVRFVRRSFGIGPPGITGNYGDRCVIPVIHKPSPMPVLDRQTDDLT